MGQEVNVALQDDERSDPFVYLRHASIGHLGIFVSGEVARREHRELLGSVNAINACQTGAASPIANDSSARY